MMATICIQAKYHSYENAMHLKQLHVTEVKEFLMTSWPYLISKFLVAYNVASDWPHAFLQPAAVLFSIAIYSGHPN